MNKKTVTIYKNDLKFTGNIEETEFQTEFESDAVKKLYLEHKSKPKIEMRIIDSKRENYEYLDLSSLDLSDELLDKLLSLERIIQILKKIKYLDISSNSLTKVPDLSQYKNIIYLSISKNKIKESITNNNLKELTCEFNFITKIVSSSIKKLCANNNAITEINLPNIQVLHINNNHLTSIQEYKNLEYLECIGNKITNIKNLPFLEEIYIGNNELSSLENLPNLKILNCVNNPIKKITYFKNVKLILCSTPVVSNSYKISNITKMKSDYLINVEVEN